MSVRFIAVTVTASVWLTPVPSVAQVNDLVSQADKFREHEVRVTTLSGDTATGLLASIDAAAVTLTTESGTRAVASADVVRLDRRGDSNRDGFVKGVLVAIPWSLLALQGYDDKGAWARDSALGALLFGGIGAGIDALRTGWTTVYDAHASPSPRGAGVRVAPGRRAAARVILRF